MGWIGALGVATALPHRNPTSPTFPTEAILIRIITALIHSTNRGEMTAEERDGRGERAGIEIGIGIAATEIGETGATSGIRAVPLSIRTEVDETEERIVGMVVEEEEERTDGVAVAEEEEEE